MRIDYLSTFLKLCEYKSFSRLAEDLNISQSTLSHRISQLEEEFGGIVLINRTTKKFELTKEGKILLNYSKLIIDLYDKCKQEIQEYSGLHSVEITISSSTLPGSHILPKYITNFKNEHANVDFKIIINNTQESIDLLKKKAVDFAGVGSFMEEQEDLFVNKILDEDELVFICSPAHKIITYGSDEVTLNELIKYPFINREEGSGTRSVFEKNFDAFDQLEPKLVINDNDSIITAVSNSNYISILSKIIAKKAEDAGLVKILTIKEFPIIAKRNIYILKLKGKPLGDLKGKFWDYIK